MDISNLNTDQNLFSGEKIGEVLILTLKDKPLLHVTDLSVKKTLFVYLDLVACCDDIKVVLVKEAPTKMRRNEYIAFYKSMIGPDIRQRPLERMYNAIGQLILKFVGLNKMVVYADSGDVILLFMNIGLACDFRIVADNTVFQNPNLELGVVPKGASTFLLSKMLGTVKASRILLSSKGINAVEARRLCIVDNVVPLNELDRAALETARSFAQIPTGYAIGVKKLLNYDIKELAWFLEFENEMLRKLIQSCKLYQEIA